MMLRALPPFLLQQTIWIPTRLILTHFGRFRVEGEEHLLGINGPIIFASNHSSELDPILLPAALPFVSRFAPIFYVSREKSFYEPTPLKRLFYGGSFFKLWGAYPARPGLKDYEQSLLEHLRIIRAGHAVLIFPEGGKTKDGNMREARGGVTFLSHKTGAPIIPVHISGVFRMNIGTFFSRKHKIKLSFGEPIHPTQVLTQQPTPEEYKEAAQLIMGKIKDIANI